MQLYTDFICVCCFFNNCIKSYNFFFKHKLLKLFISLESKYNKLQSGNRISFIEFSKQKLHISASCHVYNKMYRGKSIQERLFSQEQGDSECFPICIGVCAALPSRRASRNSSKGLEETLLDIELRTSQQLLIFFPFLFV